MYNKQPLTNEINHLEWKITTLQISDSCLLQIIVVYLHMVFRVKCSCGHPKANRWLTAGINLH